MASIMLRTLADDVTTRPRVCATTHHHSMEQEAQFSMRDSAKHQSGSRNLASIIRLYFRPEGDADLELPPREHACEPPSLLEPMAITVLLNTKIVSTLMRKAPDTVVQAWQGHSQSDSLLGSACSASETRSSG